MMSLALVTCTCVESEYPAGLPPNPLCQFASLPGQMHTWANANFRTSGWKNQRLKFGNNREAYCNVCKKTIHIAWMG